MRVAPTRGTESGSSQCVQAVTGARPIREENHGAQRSLYFEDPDGFTLEITAPPSSAAHGEDAAAKTVESWLRQPTR
jgi:hypothetical protein